MTTDNRTVLSRIGEWLLKILSVFVILEPIWMLLPFAGFLYGSVLQIERLGRNPKTAWLTHFVFPVLTGGWLGPILVLIGFIIFCIGAGQIYWAKFRKSGLVTTGLYRFVRNPQYIALTLFGFGILLTWGRAITFLSFFLMMFLYYFLARSEERTCLRLFGAEYERYRDRTSFIIPGDRYLRGKFPPLKLPAFVQVAGAFVVTLAACFGLMWLITTVKVAFQSVPFTIATVIFAPEVKQAPAMTARTVKGVPFVQAGRVAVVRGPYRNATAAGFAERVLQRLRQSAALKDFLAFLDEPAGDALVVFCAPFEKPDQPGTPGMRAGGAAGGRGPAPDPAGPDRVRLVMMRCALAPGASLDDVFAVKSKRQIRAGCIAPVNLGSPEGSDIVEGEVTRPGPKFPGEERWGFLLKQLAAQPATALPVVVPGQAASATLVLVHAPILRTRRDPEFTREIFDRLTASAKFRDRLRQSGAGGNVVAVAFPRPGPNWYREHHGQPQLSVFVMLVRHRGGELFRDRGHEFLGAFIAEMDFKITPPADCVGEVTLIGPRRDLAERWRFFLSGVR